MTAREPLVAVMPDGSARHFTLIGSYPLVYYTSDEVLCPDCALKHSQEEAMYVCLDCENEFDEQAYSDLFVQAGLYRRPIQCSHCRGGNIEPKAPDDLDVTVYWEGADYPCDRCDHLIESAYGEVED